MPTQFQVLRHAPAFVMTFAANPKRPGGFTGQGLVDMAVTAEIMKHRLDFKRNARVVLVAGITGIKTRIVLIVVVADDAFLVGMIEMLERNRQ